MNLDVVRPGAIRGRIRHYEGWADIIQEEDPEIEAVLYRVDGYHAVATLSRLGHRLVHVSGGKIPEEFADLMLEHDLMSRAELEVFLKLDADQLVEEYYRLLKEGSCG